MKTLESYSPFLKSVALFQYIKDEDLPVMLNCMKARIRTLRKGEFVYAPGETVKDLNIVLEGTVHMEKDTVWGTRSILSVIPAGDFFGENFICTRVSHANDLLYTAATPVTLMLLPFDRVLYTCTMACGFHHRIVENMVGQMAEKTNLLTEKIEVLSQKTLRDKLLTYLMGCSRKSDSEYFTIPLGRSELADYLCANRSALTRELKQMQESGILDFSGRTFRLLPGAEAVFLNLRQQE